MFRGIKNLYQKISLLSIVMLFPSLALSWDDSTSLDDVLQSLLSYLTSTPARILALLAIVGVGYGTLYLGRLPKERALAVVIGMGIIFGGAAIMRKLGLSA